MNYNINKKPNYKREQSQIKDLNKYKSDDDW